MVNKIKSFIKYIRYILIRYLKKRRFKNFYLRRLVNLSAIYTKHRSSTFFGYYNISPIRSNDTCLIGIVATEEVRGSKHTPMEIYVKKDVSISQVTKTKAWNWQQGSMLQWYNEKEIIYNDYDSIKDRYVSNILNLESGDEKMIHKAIYSISKDGSFALTLNFDRLALMRPDYGYFNRNISWEDLPDDTEDGIWYINIERNTSKLILSLEQLKNFKPDSTMIGAKHKVNHIDIAPDGNRFMFLHRWISSKGRFMRLISADCRDCDNMYIVTGNEMVSHNCWWGNEDIISFCRLEKGLDRYVHFKDRKGFIKVIGERDFSRDGHPSVSPNGRWMVTDEYPDLSRFSELHLFDLEKKRKYKIGKFYQPLKFKGEVRVDLHPKWGGDGKRISIDSAHTGKRQMYLLDIEEFLNAVE